MGTVERYPTENVRNAYEIHNLFSMAWSLAITISESDEIFAVNGAKHI